MTDLELLKRAKAAEGLHEGSTKPPRHPGMMNCGARRAGYVCTEPEGHYGQHIASGSTLVCYVWPQ